MYNFIFNVPVKILFGEKGIDKLADEILPYGTRVLICYGGGSIKRIGLYNSIIEQLRIIRLRIGRYFSQPAHRRSGERHQTGTGRQA